MSCHLSRRLTPVHRAVSMALLYSVGWTTIVSSVQAATIGKTVVTSAQHEPLAASILITDIRAADFSANLANPVIYQQMGLTPTDSMTVRFQATSATSGQVFVSTSQPVSKPFADLVLSINDNGQRNVVPKTLLMPLSDNLSVTDAAKNVVTGTKKPNLPAVSANNAKPLTVRKGAPPPLISVSNAIAAETSLPKASVSSVQAPSVTATLQANSSGYTPSRLDNGRLSNNTNIRNTISNLDDDRRSANLVDSSPLGTNNSNNIAAVNTSSTNSTGNDNSNPTVNKGLNNTALDTLNIQVTRQIQPSRQTSIDPLSALTPNTSPNTSSSNHSSENLVTSNVDDGGSSIAIAAINRMSTDKSTSKTVNGSISSTPVSDKQIDSPTTNQYQVQRNDSLWIIAQQIAQENNLDTSTVMKQIQSQNPDAFINKDADQLKADAKLSLPSYDVIPSQKKLEAAIDAQRQYIRRANTAAMQNATQKPVIQASKTSQPAQRPKRTTTTKTQTLPKAQFSVLAPGRDGNADGTQEKSDSNIGNGLSTDILATLKASRQQAASQAQRLSNTSSALDSYSQKIQLQNKKLAELQARLEKLRNQ